MLIQALNWQQQQQQQQQQTKAHASGMRNAESQWMVPRSKEQVTRYCRRFTQYIVDHMEDAVQPVEIPDHLFEATDDILPEFRPNCRAFMALLLDLVVGYVDQLKPRASFLAHSQSRPT